MGLSFITRRSITPIEYLSHRVGLSKYFRCILGVSCVCPLPCFSNCFCFCCCFHVLLAKCSRLGGLVWDPFHLVVPSSVCLLLLSQFMMRTAFHFQQFIFCGLCPLTFMVGSRASGSGIKAPLGEFGQVPN